MPNESRNHMVLPLPYIAEKKKSGGRVPRYPVSQSEPVRYNDFPSQSSLHVTRLRMGALVVVLVGVTLSMLMSLFFLFSGDHLRQPLPSFTLPSSLPVIGLMSVGGGVGIVLWITLSSLFKRKRDELPAQRSSILPRTPLMSAGARTPLPPEPSVRHTGERFSSGFEAQGDWWISSEWDAGPRKNTEKLEALHMRQRLRTLRLDDADDFPA